MATLSLPEELQCGMMCDFTSGDLRELKQEGVTAIVSLNEGYVMRWRWCDAARCTSHLTPHTSHPTPHTCSYELRMTTEHIEREVRSVVIIRCDDGDYGGDTSADGGSKQIKS